MNHYTDAEIVVHHITALVGNDPANWCIGRSLNTPIPENELHRIQALVYYPCEWDTAKEVYSFMVNNYGLQQDLWWSINSGSLIYVYKAVIP